MMFALMRRDKALRKLGWGIPYAFGVGYLWSTAWARSGGLTWVDIAAGWMLLCIVLVFSGFQVRSSQFEMALPLSPRLLWSARAAALTFTCLVLVAVAIGSACIWSTSDSQVLQAGVHFAAGALLVVALLTSPAPRRNALPVSWRLALFTILAAFVILVLTKTLLAYSPVYALGVALVAVALGFRTYRALPSAFELVPLKPERTGRSLQVWRRQHDKSIASVGSVPSMSALYSGIFRILLPWEWWIVLGMMLVLAAMPGGWRMSMLVLIVLPIMFMPVMQGFKQVAHLPISRRLVFAFATLPGLVAWAGGYALGRLLWNSSGISSLQMTYQPGGLETSTFVNLEFDHRLLAVLWVAGGLLWLAGHLVQLEPHRMPAHTLRAWRYSRWRRYGMIGAIYGVLMLGMACLLVDHTPPISGFRQWVVYHLATGLSWFQQIIPENPVLSWSVVCMLLAGMYLWLLSRFSQIEATFDMEGNRS